MKVTTAEVAKIASGAHLCAPSNPPLFPRWGVALRHKGYATTAIPQRHARGVETRTEITFARLVIHSTERAVSIDLRNA